MPKRTDLRKLLIVGSGPIQIGQAAEFDFSGSQAALSLREEGYETVIVNSNPATIQTDVETADRVYVEPLTAESLARILRRERPQGILSGMGGQTGLNLCSELAESGALEKYGVELLGTPLSAIEKSEDRDLFKKTMEEIGEPVCRAKAVTDHKQALEFARQIGFPVLVRPAYTLGGSGSGIAHNEAQLAEICSRGLSYSRIHQVLIEESVLGWKEFEYEVMRDSADNCITICNMENLDPMGIHTGESIVVAPSQTLSDDEHQTLRSAALKIIRALGIQGGCNVQFAVDPSRFEYRVIEVNPRVSRSSALASKATGYPIARVSAKIAVGMTLDEIVNRVTGTTPASFEPALDYVITKIPRWPFDKFRTVDRHLGTQMKSTGEVMSIGRTIEESLQKALRSLEIDRASLDWTWPSTEEDLWKELSEPTDRRLYAVAELLRKGASLDKVAHASRIDPFFLVKIRNVVQFEEKLKQAAKAGRVDRDVLARAKRMGFADEHLATLLGRTEQEVRDLRRQHGIAPVYKMVDTCAAEFEAQTPYFYSTYAETEEVKPPEGTRKVMVLGSGPIRIGQGIEFDYACVHAAKEIRAQGLDAIMVNNNPETVSTDFDTSTRLYFEPLALEDVLHVIERERPEGVVVQFGGQTSINLATPLAEAIAQRGLPTRILGTPPTAIDTAEDREKFAKLMDRLKIPQPAGALGRSFEEVKEAAARIGYPVLVRPSFVLGGRGMEIVYDEKDLEGYMREAVRVGKNAPVLVDKYLTNAIEVDVDAVCDGTDVFLGGMLEHIEEAGVHSGDATMVLPPQTLPREVVKTIELYTRKIALALGVVGCVNCQFAVKDNKVYILEANPRASRTVPFVSKAIGVPLARVATRVMLGQKLSDMSLQPARTRTIAVKASVFPFQKLAGVDSILGPEMKSTGEVMGLDTDFHKAFWKAMEAAGMRLPTEGAVYISVRDEDKERVLPLATELSQLGFALYATKGTSSYLRDFGVACETAWRISEGRSPDAIDLMRNGTIKLVLNTPTLARGARRDGYMMRRLAVELNIPYLTNMAAATAAVHSIRAFKDGRLKTMAIDEYAGTA
ncbi:MAG TPA: carbamoyl-phosphate synthase large subunit, partial [Candidatus Thermoplasmatota archaeon]|nr:carbamoyl-phosphate synthase large subunit [Candidatus Thermoplasmatota archaeon]